MKHTSSVEVAYHCAQQVRDVFHQATPAHGRHLAAHLMKRLPTCPIPEIAHLGPTPLTWKDAHLAYFDTGGASNAPHRSHQRNHRTRQTHRQRLPQPHQLPTPNAPHRKRPRRLHPHPTMKRRYSAVGQSTFFCLLASRTAQSKSSRATNPGRRMTATHWKVSLCEYTRYSPTDPLHAVLHNGMHSCYAYRHSSPPSSGIGGVYSIRRRHNEG